MHYIQFYLNYQRRNLGCISTEADPMNEKLIITIALCVLFNMLVPQ